MRERTAGRPGRLWLGALLLSIAASPATAQEYQQLDGGTFEHFVEGSFAGSETFAVRRRGEDLIAVGRITREGGADDLQSLEVGVRFDGRGRLLRYELHTREGAPLHVVVNRTGSRLRVTMASPEGERVTEFLAADRLLVLEREIVHLYYDLATILRAAAEPRGMELEVLVPSEGRKLPLRVAGLSRDTVAVGEARVAATRFELRLADETIVLWISTADGRIARAASPDRQWAAIRTSLD